MSLQPPVINTFGIYTLLPPFTIDPVDYRCAAIQLLSALIDTGVDAFTLYYVPVGLTENDYRRDVFNNVSIITLLSDDGPTIYVPASYIGNAPVEISIPYSRLVITLDLGELPDSLQFLELLNYLRDVTQDGTGVRPKVGLVKVPIKKRYTPAQHTVAEATRLANVKNLVSFYKGKTSADAELLVARQHIQALEELLINNP